MSKLTICFAIPRSRSLYRPRLKHSPFLVIVFSTRPIHALARAKGYTYQIPDKVRVGCQASEAVQRVPVSGQAGTEAELLTNSAGPRDEGGNAVPNVDVMDVEGMQNDRGAAATSQEGDVGVKSKRKARSRNRVRTRNRRKDDKDKDKGKDKLGQKERSRGKEHGQAQEQVAMGTAA